MTPLFAAPDDSGKEGGKESGKSGDRESGKSRNWKGKLQKSIRRFGSSPSPGRIAVVPESTGMFNCPLEDCVPSPYNEVELLSGTWGVSFLCVKTFLSK